MKALIYIQVKPLTQVGFGNPLDQWARANLPQVNLLDADSHSDALVIDHEINVLNDCDQVALILELLPDAKPGQVVKLLEKVIRRPNLSLLVLKSGSNQLVDNMLKISRIVPVNVTSHDETQSQLSSFFKA